MTFNIELLPEKIRNQITVDDRGDKLHLSHGYVEDQELFKEVGEAVEEQGGKYLGYYSGAAHYEIPKPKESTPTDAPISIPKDTPTEKESEDEAEYLKPTYEKLGPLIPVFRSPDGDIIDGKHRLQIDPKWQSLEIKTLNDPVKKAMARLVVNVVRRKVPPEEKRQLLTEIAKLTKWTPQQIADAIGMSYDWVMKYLPKEFKDKTMAKLGAKGGKASALRRQAEKELPRRVNCEKCHIGTLNPQTWKDHQLCPVCFEKAERGEFDKNLKPQEPKPVTPKESIPDDEEEWDLGAEPEITHESIVTMKKPYKTTYAEEPTETMIREDLVDLVTHDEQFREYFEITIKEVQTE